MACQRQRKDNRPTLAAQPALDGFCKFQKHLAVNSVVVQTRTSL